MSCRPVWSAGLPRTDRRGEARRLQRSVECRRPSVSLCTSRYTDFPSFSLVAIGFAKAGFDARRGAPPFWVHRQNDLPQPFLLSRLLPEGPKKTSPPAAGLDSFLPNTVHCILSHNMMSHDSAGRDKLTNLPPTVQIGNTSGAHPPLLRTSMACRHSPGLTGAELPTSHPAASAAAHRVEGPRARRRSRTSKFRGWLSLPAAHCPLPTDCPAAE